VAKVREVRPEFRVQALTVVCTDHRRSERFYRTVLGATDVPTADPGYGCPWLQLGSLTLTLMPNASERSPVVPGTHASSVLWLEVNDLDAAAKWFDRHQVEIIRPPDGLFMEIADPDGLVIEVWQAQTRHEPEAAQGTSSSESGD
jgi:predicted enzyme related to lactoylglutathione lyase